MGMGQGVGVTPLPGVSTSSAVASFEIFASSVTHGGAPPLPPLHGTAPSDQRGSQLGAANDERAWQPAQPQQTSHINEYQ